MEDKRKMPKEKINRSGRDLIIAERVSKDYKRGRAEIVRAIKEADMEVKDGEFLAIVGPSGCGKTTLLNLLSGLDQPTEGRIIFDGMDTSMIGEERFPLIRREKCGFVFQTFNLIETITAQENVESPLWPTDLNDREITEQAISLLKAVDLLERKDHKPLEMSGGEQQRVAIARALANTPKILFVDEPTGNLDSEAGKSIMELLKKLNEEHEVTVVLVTHNQDLLKYADRVIKLQDGRITES
jgi:putative ABC transport system ATP-binding protein